MVRQRRRGTLRDRRPGNVEEIKTFSVGLENCRTHRRFEDFVQRCRREKPEWDVELAEDRKIELLNINHAPRRRFLRNCFPENFWTYRRIRSL